VIVVDASAIVGYVPFA